MLTEVRLRGEGRRYDRGHGHREELGKDRERLRQVEGDGRISQQLDARYVAHPAGGVCFRTGDRVERPGAPAARAGREYAQEALPHRGGCEPRAVMELYARSPVEHVPEPARAPAGYGPTNRPRGEQPALQGQIPPPDASRC